MPVKFHWFRVIIFGDICISNGVIFWGTPYMWQMPWKEMPRNSGIKMEDGPCAFRPGRSITDQIFTLKQIFEKSGEYGKDLFACFVDLEKACDRVHRDKLWKDLQQYGVNGQLLRAIKSFYCRPEVWCSDKWQAIKAVPYGRWTPARVRFVTSPFHCSY